ncbi:S66 peptidase family protein [Streptococcus halichoeri]|uniref:S66 family peptidase n=1 Tax=Streptococcus halichoeri TaxID=254785 RepID=UPI00135782DD|nr:S66 peptidase family protein [Streptococcus halichoeri]
MVIKKIGIVSLSLGILGEDFVAHERHLGLHRLKAMGLEVVFLPNALNGCKDLKAHPEKRAADLLAAFADDSIDLILCAIGGDDTYRLLPYLFENNQLAKVATQKPFLGFSDTTMNHLMLHKLGLHTFYGQAFLPDICELSAEMLPYTKNYFAELVESGRITQITPSELWYTERTDFSEAGLGLAMQSHPNQGFEHLSGPPIFQGNILGGCLESLYSLFDRTKHPDTVQVCQQYHLFPSLKAWQGKILLLETSEEKPNPRLFRRMIVTLKDRGLFDVISGLLVGKPQNETYYQDYKTILLEELGPKGLPILANINVGHATPRCIIPFGIEALVDADKQVITFQWD